MEQVDVEILPESLMDEPVAVIRDGRRWIVGAEPVMWFERLPWWEFTRRAPRGYRVRVDQQVWRLQLRLGRNPANELLTVEIYHHHDTDKWYERPVTANPSWR